MKNYRITVNGHVYEVTVEEKGAQGGAHSEGPQTAGAEATAPAPQAAKPQTAQAQTAQTAPAQATAPKVMSVSAGQGAVKIRSNLPGKVLKVEAPAGTSVKAGDKVVIIESMKMEIAVTAPKDGVIVSIEAAPGMEVQDGSLIATMD